MDDKVLQLNEDGLWLMYRAIVCETIVQNELEEYFDRDLWSWTECLDTSFEETANLEFSDWRQKIVDDLEEYISCEIKRKMH